MERGIALPSLFDGNGALDGEPVFALGELAPQEERAWIARLAWKLQVHCGKLLRLRLD